MSEVVADWGEIGNVVCDLDGVVYRGAHPIPGAGDALRALVERGVHVLFATNNSTRTPHQTARRIRELTAFAADPDQVVGSAEAAALHLAAGRPGTYVVGEEGIVAALAGRGVPQTDEDAEAVVVGLDRDFTYEKLHKAAAFIRSGAAFVATNTDVTFPDQAGLHPGAGALVAAVEAASGVAPVVAGKPHAPMRRLIVERLRPGRTVVVGDRPETDLALARAAGWLGVLVLTGVVNDATEVPDAHRPDVVLDSIADLPRLFQT